MFTALGTVGLILDFVGAALIAWDLWTLRDRQWRLARLGVALLAAGFLLQALGSDGARAAAGVVYVAAPSFWTVFFAALAAVLAAHVVTAALSMGLWRLYTKRRGWQAQVEERRNSLICLAHLRRALETNIKAGNWYHEQPLAARVPNHGLEIDSATWHAFRHELASCLTDVQLRVDLSGYFADIDEFARAHHEYLRLTERGAPVSNAEGSRVVDRLQRFAYQAVVGGRDLLDRVMTLTQRLEREIA